MRALADDLRGVSGLSDLPLLHLLHVAHPLILPPGQPELMPAVSLSQSECLIHFSARVPAATLTMHDRTPL